LSLGYASALLEPSPLARAVLFGLMLFWGVRLLVQWFVYDWQLWRGNRFHTIVHFAFTGLWTYAACVYGWAWCTQLTAY
jgi:hypothetical protein